MIALSLISSWRSKFYFTFCAHVKAVLAGQTLRRDVSSLGQPYGSPKSAGTQTSIFAMGWSFGGLSFWGEGCVPKRSESFMTSLFLTGDFVRLLQSRELVSAADEWVSESLCGRILQPPSSYSFTIGEEFSEAGDIAEFKLSLPDFSRSFLCCLLMRFFKSMLILSWIFRLFSKRFSRSSSSFCLWNVSPSRSIEELTLVTLCAASAAIVWLSASLYICIFFLNYIPIPTKPIYSIH